MSGIAGTVTYTTQDEQTFADSAPEFWGASNSKVEIRALLGQRPVVITIGNLAEGSTRQLAHDESAKACLRIQSAGPPTCLLLDGTVEVLRLRHEDCEGNENITFCSEDVDLYIHATSKDLGLSLAMDLHVVSVQKWHKSACAD